MNQCFLFFFLLSQTRGGSKTNHRGDNEGSKRGVKLCWELKLLELTSVIMFIYSFIDFIFLHSTDCSEALTLEKGGRVLTK